MNIQSLPDPQDIEEALELDQRGRRRSFMRRATWLLVLLAIAAGAAWFAAGRESTDAVAYETVPAALSPITVTVTATGKIQPTTQVDVSSEMSGIVRTVNVDANSLVKKGDVLAELDIERLNAQLARARANVDAAKARIVDSEATVAEKRQDLARASALNEKGFSARQALDSARAAHDRAVAGVAAAKADAAVAEADLRLQETDIAKSRIVSPVDGIVLKRSAEPGQTVASSLQAPVLFTLAEDLTRMQVEADVDEADIGMVKAGQKAGFTVDAYPGRSFPARIVKVEFSPNVTDNVVTYKAVLEVDNAELLLRPGMTATAEIVVNEIAQTLAIPNAALRFKLPSAETQEGFSFTRLFIPRMPRFERSRNEEAGPGERTIHVLKDGAPVPVPVRTGLTDGRLTEVKGGALAAGDAVIVSVSRNAK